MNHLDSETLATAVDALMRDTATTDTTTTTAESPVEESPRPDLRIRTPKPKVEEAYDEETDADADDEGSEEAKHERIAFRPQPVRQVDEAAQTFALVIVAIILNLWIVSVCSTLLDLFRGTL